MNSKWTGPIVGTVALAIAAGVLLFVASGLGGMSENLVYYWSPTELVAAGEKAYTSTIRLGGQVELGTKDWDPETNTLKFTVTDGNEHIPVTCTGAPPQMFREGIGVVVEGRYSADGQFETDRVLIKHSNEYRAPEEGERPEQVFETLVSEES